MTRKRIDAGRGAGSLQSQSAGRGDAGAPAKAIRQPRIGAAKGEFVVPDSFFEPLPDEMLEAFRGK